MISEERDAEVIWPDSNTDLQVVLHEHHHNFHHNHDDPVRSLDLKGVGYLSHAAAWLEY